MRACLLARRIAPNEPPFRGQRGPETEPKQPRNGPQTVRICPVNPPKACGIIFGRNCFGPFLGPKQAIWGVLSGSWAAGRRAPPPSAPRCGVLGVRLTRSEGWKPPKPGGGTQEKCPQNQDLGCPARDTAIFQFWTAERRAGWATVSPPPAPPQRGPVRGPRRAFRPF